MSPTAPAATASGPSAATDRTASLVGSLGQVALDAVEQAGPVDERSRARPPVVPNVGVEPPQVRDERLQPAGVEPSDVDAEAPAIASRQAEGQDVVVGLRREHRRGECDRVVVRAADGGLVEAGSSNQYRVGRIGHANRPTTSSSTVGARPREEVAHHRVARVDRRWQHVAELDLRSVGGRSLGQRDLEPRRAPPVGSVAGGRVASGRAAVDERRAGRRRRPGSAA